MYEVKEPFWLVVDHWQTLIAALIAGILALGAAGWTVWATMRAAKRQVKAVTETAGRQITAAHGQTKAAQRQTAVMREIERRRIAAEGYAFHAMLEAAMGAVIEDVAAARKLPLPRPEAARGEGGYSEHAYAVRQHIKRAGFAELRSALVRFGGALTTQFLQLDKEIEDFAGQWRPRTPRVSAGLIGSLVPPPLGFSDGLEEQLTSIEQQATALRDEAATGMKRCRDELAKELVNLGTDDP
jgi:hypothetical protein